MGKRSNQSSRLTSSFFISSSILRYRAKALLPSECPRHGGYQVRVFDLLVEVAYKGLPCRVGGRHLV